MGHFWSPNQLFPSFYKSVYVFFEIILDSGHYLVDRKDCFEFLWKVYILLKAFALVPYKISTESNLLPNIFAYNTKIS